MHLEKIKSLIDLLGASPLAEIELIEGDHAIRLTRRAPAAFAGKMGDRSASIAAPSVVSTDTRMRHDVSPVTSRDAPSTTSIDAASLEATATAAATAATTMVPVTNAVVRIDVTAPMFGIVHLQPAPDAAPFVHVGQRVEAGATLCTIEAMKTFNAVEAEIGGTIAEVLVSTGTDVEADNILFRIAP